MSQTLFDESEALERGDDLAARAANFCETTPYRIGDFGKRNWGGQIHSLCSYQGKLKPSIAHFLVRWFTKPGDRILDPMAGVGTIPLEARRQGRVGLASDLSPLADAVSRAKLEPVSGDSVWRAFDDLGKYLADHASTDVSDTDVQFGLNGPIESYFHERTLREIVLARRYFSEGFRVASRSANDVVRSNLLHILHGNRPYALSRRSHPVTPFRPSGESIYRPVMSALGTRLVRVVPELVKLAETTPNGEAQLADFRAVDFGEPVDAVITSPPFSQSLRFWSSNWMRLWFAGWEPSDFKSEPKRFLEVEQRDGFGAYGEFAEAMHRKLKPGGTLIMHLGESARTNMAEAIRPQLSPLFEIVHVGRESVSDTESHGLTDKGATLAHLYLFATARR